MGTSTFLVYKMVHVLHAVHRVTSVLFLFIRDSSVFTGDYSTISKMRIVYIPIKLEWFGACTYKFVFLRQHRLSDLDVQAQFIVDVTTS